MYFWSSMNISLILTSYDRQQDLDRFTNGICEQSFQGEIELLYVAQGPARVQLTDPKASVKVVERNHGARIPLSKARNIGLDGFSGDIIGFPDDDCWYGPDVLSDVTQYFEAHPEVDCICTRVFDPERQVALGRRPAGVVRNISFANLFRLPISVGIFVRRAAFLRAGCYFDESLGAGTSMGAGEETEFIARLLDHSSVVHYVGTIQVYHPVPRYTENDAPKQYQYCIGFGYLHGYLIRAGHFSVLLHLADVLGRSCVAIVWYCFVPLYRTVYVNRLRGIYQGFKMGLFHTNRVEAEAGKKTREDLC